MSHEPSDDAGVVAHFLERLLADRAGEGERSLEEYRERYPGFEDVVEREFRAAQELAGGTPRTFGPYRLVRTLGRGGQATVHLAQDPRLGRAVALKVLSDASLSPARHDRLRREATIAGAIDHPGICPVYETGVIGDDAYIAMRYVEGESLKRTLARDASAGRDARRVQRMKRIAWIEEVCRIVHHAHERGVLHRDLKPSNVLITPEGRPVVVDFGLAYDLGDPLELTRSDEWFGTTPYLAPELLEGRGVRDRLGDVYALGVTLFQCATGVLPYRAATTAGLVRAILDGPTPHANAVDETVSRDLTLVIATAMERDPMRRYRSALDLAEDLARWRRREPVHARPLSRARRTLRWIRREPLRATTLALAITLAATTGFLLARWPEFRAGRELVRNERVEAWLEEGFLRLAEGYLSPPSEGVEDATEPFHEALAIDPSSTEAIAGLVLALRALGRLEEARTELGARAPLAREPAALEPVRRSLDPALGPPNAPVADPPQTPLGWFLATRVELGSRCEPASGSFEHARAWMTRCVLSSERARALYHFELAHVLGHANHPDAVDLAAVIERRFGDSSQAWFRIGFALAGQDQERALAAFDRALAMRPDHLVARRQRADLLGRMERFEQARTAYEEILERAPANPDVHVRLAELAARRNDRTKRIEHLRAAARDRPTYGLNLARAYVEQRAYDDAVLAYEDVLRQARDPRALDGLAVVRYRQQRFEEAAALLEEALTLAPDNVTALSHQGNVQSALGRADEAIAAFRRALELEPTHVETLVNLGRELRLRGRFEAAIEVYERALTHRPNESAARYQLARSRHQSGDLERARVDYEAAIALAPESAETHCNLAHVSRALGDVESALAQMQRGAEFGRRSSQWSYPADAWIATFQDLLDLRHRWHEQGDAVATELTGERRLRLAEALVELAPRRSVELFSAELPPDGDVAHPVGWFAARAALAVIRGAADAAGATAEERRRAHARAVVWTRRTLETAVRQREAGTLDAERFSERLHFCDALVEALRDPPFADAGGDLRELEARLAAVLAPYRER